MPALACRTCGRRLNSPTALESLGREERRCPRCGAPLEVERRHGERRGDERRKNPPDDPGPRADTGERRVVARRSPAPRRRSGPG